MPLDHRRENGIASYRLENRARLDLFAAAMLGNLDIVRATLETYPNAFDILGLHGIPLIAHAQEGGNEAIPVVEYLISRASQKTEARNV